MFGVLNLYKPAGWSSRDAVNRVQRLVRPAKAGHAGTLDPIAEGVLVVCVGPATRLIEYVQQAAKQYRATFLLGRSSASDDIETEIDEAPAARPPTLQEIEAALPGFRGVIRQRPPAYSAIKVDGQRAYKLARRGDAVELAAREVEVYALSIARYDYPELVLEICCSGGVYVRSLGRDLAAAAGTCAVMSALVRTAVGDYRIADAIDPRGMDAGRLQAGLLSPLTAVHGLPQLVLTPGQLEQIHLGGLIEAAFDRPVAAVDEHGRLVAILKPARSGLLRPSPNFLPMA